MVAPSAVSVQTVWSHVFASCKERRSGECYKLLEHAQIFWILFDIPPNGPILKSELSSICPIISSVSMELPKLRNIEILFCN